MKKMIQVIGLMTSVMTLAMTAHATCDNAEMSKVVSEKLNSKMAIALEGRILAVTKDNIKFSIVDKNSDTKRVYGTFNWKTELETYAISGTNVFVADLDLASCDLVNEENAVVR